MHIDRMYHGRQKLVKNEDKDEEERSYRDAQRMRLRL